MVLWGSKVLGSILRTGNLIDMFGEFFSYINANASIQLGQHHSLPGRFQIIISDHLNIRHKTGCRIETDLNIHVIKKPIRYMYLTSRGPCIEIYSYNRSQQGALFLYFILIKNSTCFVHTYCSSAAVLILYSQQLVFVILVMLTVC